MPDTVVSAFTYITVILRDGPVIAPILQVSQWWLREVVQGAVNHTADKWNKNSNLVVWLQSPYSSWLRACSHLLFLILPKQTLEWLCILIRQRDLVEQEELKPRALEFLLHEILCKSISFTAFL